MFVLDKSASSLRSLSQIFTPANFNKIVKKQDRGFTRYRVKKHVKFDNSKSYNDVIQFLYKELHQEYRSEYFYKNALLNDQLIKKYSLETTTVLNEFKIGSSIADFVLLNGEARVFEIKTDLDSLTKLEKQISDYIKFANKVYIVTCSKHAKRLIANYHDSFIGIIEFTKDCELITLKEAQSNTIDFNYSTIFKTLRKQEYLDLLEDHFGELPNVPSTKIFRECLALAKEINIVDFQNLAFNKLKERKLRCPELLISDNTPFELKHICYSMDLSEKEYAGLYNFLTEMI